MNLGLAFIAGLLSVFSPCVLPLAPIIIAGARSRDPRGPIALALGLALTFGVVGGAIASFGVALGEAGFVRAIAAAIMVAAGVIILIPALGLGSERALSSLSQWGEGLSKHLPSAGLWGFAGAGVVLAFAWAPCVGPTLGAAFALAASGGSVAAAIATMFLFSLGAALALLGVGYGFGRLAARGRWMAGRTARLGRAAFAIVLIAAGLAILTGFDRALEAAALSASPAWLIALTTRF
jgi:cytochrome c biogenesis protein CcdA